AVVSGQVGVAADAGADDVLDLRPQLDRPVARPTSGFLPVPDALAAVLDPKTSAPRLKGVAVRRIIGLSGRYRGDGEQRSSHRVLMIGLSLILMTLGAACIADVADSGVNVLERAGVVQTWVA